nr:trna-specific adenosine deaminase 1 [Quercus suber]
MPPHPDAIADCVLQAFRALPAKCKPRVNIGGLGRREWGILAGVVLRKRGSRVAAINSDVPDCKNHSYDDGTLQANSSECFSSRLMCAALATGMKCLPQSKLAQAQGNVLHDWHAEILALRAFNRWLVDECLLHCKGAENSSWVQWNEPKSNPMGEKNEDERASDPRHWRRPFALRPDVDIYMYVSEAPCGDASMELTMADQEDDTPWSDSSALPPTSSSTYESLLGRGHFSRLGIVRRKPARPDAPLTLSKSCSDKLALKQCTSLLNSVTSLLLDPRDVYLQTLVLPQDRLVGKAVDRAFGPHGRMKVVHEQAKEFGDHGYGVKFFDVLGTAKRFEFEKAAEAVPSNIAALSMASGGEGKMEILINGVLQGRKQFDPRGASCVSRRKMTEAVAALLEASEMTFPAPEIGTYGALKQSAALEVRRNVKEKVRDTALQGWVRNQGDEDWDV